jgi:hypothetical protein
MQITYGSGVPASPVWASALSSLKLSWCHVAWTLKRAHKFEICLIAGPHNEDLEYEDTSAPFWLAASQAALENQCSQLQLKVLWGLGEPSLFLKFCEDDPETRKVPHHTLLNISGEPLGRYNGVLSKTNGERRVFWRE